MNALPTQGKFLFEFGSAGTGNGQFMGVNGIAVNEFGEIITVDTTNDRIQVFDRCGNFLFAFGEEGSGTGQFQIPFSIAVTEDNNIAVGDILRNVILVFDRCGNFLFEFGAPILTFPSRLAVNEWGDILVTGNAEVVVFDRCGNFLFSFDLVDGTGEVKGLDVDSDGNIYVNDFERDLIHVYDRSGRFLFEFGGGMFSVAGPLAISESGEIVALDLFGPAFVFSRCGDLLFEIRIDPVRFVRSDVAISEDGNIYITDNNNGRILVFKGQSLTR